jgi:hypothetical protein
MKKRLPSGFPTADEVFLSSSLFASKAAGNSTAAANKAAATKPAGVVRTVALTVREKTPPTQLRKLGLKPATCRR